jgi:starch synthase
VETTVKGTVALIPWGHAVEDFLDPVGLTLDDFAERMTGGWLFGYVAALRTAGWDCAIVCASSAVAEPRRLIHAGTGAPILAVPVRSGRGRAGTLRTWLGTPWGGFARAIREAGADAILVQEYEDARFDGMVLLAMNLGLPLYGVFQGGDVTASPLEALVRPLTLRLATGLIVPSRRERQRLRARYLHGGRRVAAVPNPVDLDEWRRTDRAEARADLHLPGDCFLAVTHGRIDIWRKGLDVLLRAWTRLRAQHPRARLVLIGSGQDDARFRALLDEEAPSALTWISDYVTDRALIRRWLSAADVYVSASRVEGMPVAPLEAMAMGLPVIATDAHGLPDIFQDGRDSGGVLVPRGEPEPLAAALAELYADDAGRARLGAAARRTVEARYGVPAVGEALALALEQARPDRRAHTPRPPRPDPTGLAPSA